MRARMLKRKEKEGKYNKMKEKKKKLEGHEMYVDEDNLKKRKNNIKI
jgi:hypothetical protein